MGEILDREVINSPEFSDELIRKGLSEFNSKFNFLPQEIELLMYLINQKGSNWRILITQLLERNEGSSGSVGVLIETIKKNIKDLLEYKLPDLLAIVLESGQSEKKSKMNEFAQSSNVFQKQSDLYPLFVSWYLASVKNENTEESAKAFLVQFDKIFPS